MGNKDVIERFYKALQQKDFRTMQSLYAPEARFHDQVFLDLDSSQAKAMWEMLLTSSTDLKIEYSNLREDSDSVSCDWQATYTFTMTGKKVHNIIHADFTVSGGKIINHRDHFDLYRWSRMAFGVKGIILGWTSFMQNQIRTRARRRLQKFMETQSATAG